MKKKIRKMHRLHKIHEYKKNIQNIQNIQYTICNIQYTNYTTHNTQNTIYKLLNTQKIQTMRVFMFTLKRIPKPMMSGFGGRKFLLPRIMKLPVVRYSPVGAVFETWWACTQYADVTILFSHAWLRQTQKHPACASVRSGTAAVGKWLQLSSRSQMREDKTTGSLELDTQQDIPLLQEKI